MWLIFVYGTFHITRLIKYIEIRKHNQKDKRLRMKKNALKSLNY